MVEPLVVQATEKGQIVIPAALRKKFGIQKGTRIRIFEEQGVIELCPDTPQYARFHIEAMRGKFKGSGALEELMADRAWEIEHDEKKYRERETRQPSRVR